MPLRNQPYLPLYVQDFLTDEKLIECSASSTGVYIRLMCMMHKSEEYGTILLKQKDKQNESIVDDFALKVAKQMPYSIKVVTDAIVELLDENVLQIDGDYLIQSRMVKDNDISEKRSDAGKRGGDKTQFALAKVKAKAKAKVKANAEDEIVNEILIPDELNNDLFIENWKILISMPKWEKKPLSAIQKSIDKIKKYDIDFAIELVEDAISGNYQGLCFPTTELKYKQWKKDKDMDFDFFTDEQKDKYKAKIWNDLFNSSEWIKLNMRYLSISELSVKTLLRDFLNKIIADESIYEPLSEVKKHFVNWAKKQSA